MRRHPAVLPWLLLLFRDRCEELELDVVRDSEDKHRGVRFVSDRGLGEWLVGCVGAYDAVGLEVLLPEFKIVAGRDCETTMVESGRSFDEKAAVVVVVSVQRDHQLSVTSGENSSDAAMVRYVENGVDIEDRFVPANAGIEVGDGERRMVQPGLGDVGQDLP